MHARNTATIKRINDGTQLFGYMIGIVEVLLLSRFVLKLFDAASTAGFSNFIYKLTYPLSTPFLNFFNVTSPEKNIFEWTTLLAIVVYWLAAVASVKIFFMVRKYSFSKPKLNLNIHKKQIKKSYA
jgi:hypothetical protein